jgi:hypothetical protein
MSIRFIFDVAIEDLTILNHDSLTSSETRVRSGMRSRGRHSSELHGFFKPLVMFVLKECDQLEINSQNISM